jgi:hypothetical protein
MDLEEYWQENKRFLARVGIGLAVFLVGLGVVDATVGGERKRLETAVAATQRNLAAPFFTAADRDLAEADHTALAATVEALRAQVEFQPREQFRGAAGALDTARYISTASRVRSELLPLASRRNVSVDPTLGIPDTSPTRTDEIERHLDALDVVERVVRGAIDERVKRVTKVTVKLDPGLNSRKGVGRIERTRVVFELEGDDLALQRLVARTQLAEPAPLVIESANFNRSQRDPQVVVLELTVLVVRVQAPAAESEEST